MEKINVGDYIVEFLYKHGVTDVFGYQGGMITYLFDAFARHKDKILYHETYNEQGAAFAACGYAQVTGKVGFAFSTSGPGFTNLMTGIANAYYDSTPVIFVSGQVNFKDKKHGMPLRQKGFQEIIAPEIAKPITLGSFDIDYGTQIVDTFNKAYELAMSKRRGPIFIEIPINVFRDDVEFEDIELEKKEYKAISDSMISFITEKINKSKRPVIIAGAGINQCNLRNNFREFVENIQIPVVTTLPSVDLLPTCSLYNYGYIGASGKRVPNFIVKEADLVLTLGTRLSSRQVGHHFEKFAPNAELIRVDIDLNEFIRKIKPNEIEINCELNDFINSFTNVEFIQHKEWLNCCYGLREKLDNIDSTYGNEIMKIITNELPENSNIILDVGKNQIWGGQSSQIKGETKLLMSAGLGSMGYSLPASIGAYYGNKHLTYSFNGDGGIQMNIQELQTISKNNLPIKIFVLNNRSLGMISLFQDQYFESRYTGSKESCEDYYSANILEIANAYEIKSYHLNQPNDILKYKSELISDEPVLFDIEIDEDEPILPGIPAGDDLIEKGPKLDNIIKDYMKKCFKEIK